MIDEVVVERWRLRIRRVGERLKVDLRTKVGWRVLEVFPLDDDWRHDELLECLRDFSMQYEEFLEDYRENRYPTQARTTPANTGVFTFRGALGVAR